MARRAQSIHRPVNWCVCGLSVLIHVIAFPENSLAQSSSQISLTMGLTSPRNTRDVVSKKPVSEYDYTVTYRYEIDMNAFDSTSEYIVDYDLMRLEIGDNGLTHYYSTSADRRDSIMYRARMSADNREGVVLDGWMPEGRFALYEDTYLNWPEAGKLTVRMGFSDFEYEYEEPVPRMDWIFLDTVAKTVCSYRCLAAQTVFRGRHYTAWFALDVPINAGPWKFRSLPGLIMAVEESTGVFSWEAVGISAEHGDIYMLDPEYDCITNHVPCGVPRASIRRISRKQALELEKRRWADPYAFILSGSGSVRVIRKEGDKIISDEEVTALNREEYALSEVPALELE